MDESDTVVVTGASSGIGRATAVRFGEEGAHVVLAARREDRLRTVAEAVTAAGGTATVQPTDVTDGSAVRELLDAARAEGAVDTVVAGAGVLETDPVHDASVGDWEQMVEVNLLGAMRVARAAVGPMRERGEGDICFVSSVNAHKSSPEGGGYCASKAGLDAFAETLRQEVADTSVRVSVVEPGLVDTEMQPAEVAEEHPTLDPAAVAETVAFAAGRPPGVNVNRLQVRPTGQEF